MRIPFSASAAIGLLSLAAHQAHAGSPEIIQLHTIETEQKQSGTDNFRYFIQPSIPSDYQYFNGNTENGTLDIGVNFNSFSITTNILNIDKQNISDEGHVLDVSFPNVSVNYNFGQGNISLGYAAEKFESDNQPVATSYNTNIDVEYKVSNGLDIYSSIQLNDFDEHGISSDFESHTAIILGTSVSF